LLADVYIGKKEYFQARALLNGVIEKVEEQWVKDEAQTKLNQLDQIENGSGSSGSRSGEIEIDLVPDNE
jgi:hypothetical protein